jgi:hypothetical protein
VLGAGQHQRYGYRGNAEESALHRRRHGAGIQHVVAEVGAIVDAGNQDVGLLLEQPRDGDVHAIGRGAVNVVAVLVDALHS